MPTNEHDQKRQPHAADPNSPGYELTDVNVNGITVFLSGLVGSLAVFFLFCWVMGKTINATLIRADGPPDKWHQAEGGRTQVGLTSNPEFQQRRLQQMTETFPEPRVDLDDGNQQTADLHAREDLMLDHYSSIQGSSNVRIPIDHAMELIAQRGLPVHQAATPEVRMAGDVEPQVQAPLTTGFARTGYEQAVIAAREQKINFGRAEAAAHAELQPATPAK
jgi:hypothetical protein